MPASTKTARIAGACYLVTHVTSIAALVLYGPVLHDPGFVAGTGSDNGVLLGGLLEVICAIAIVGTAVALFPAVRRRSEGGAIAYVGLRTLEAGIILVGVVSLLAVVTLRQTATGTAGTAGTDAASLAITAKALVAVHDWTFLVGPNFVCAADTFVLAYLMWRSRLVPRFIAGLGLAGGPLLFISAIAVLFGAYQQVSLPGAIAPLPVFAWELGLALWLILKGFSTPGHAPAPSSGAAQGPGRDGQKAAQHAPSLSSR
jgi:hypothetical protein